MLHLAAYRRHDGGGQVRIAHKRAAIAFRDDFSCGAAHVDVDVGEALAHDLLDPSGLRSHGVRLVAEQLNRDHVLALRQVEQMTRFLVGVGQALGGNHLGVCEIGALFAAQCAERHIRNARHGRK